MKTKMKWSKVLSLVLALALVVGMLPLMGERASAQQPENANAQSTVAGGNVIPDPVLKKLINEQLPHTPDNRRPADAPVTKEDMERLQYLQIGPLDKVHSLEGIQYAVNLHELRISSKIESGVEQIKYLSNLRDVTIHSNVVDLSWLKNNMQMRNLSFDNCTGFKDLTGLGSKPALKYLTFFMLPELETLNGLSSSQYPALEVLRASRCKALHDISALRDKLPKLTELDLEGYNNITDITPLKDYRQLKDLELEKVTINDQNRQSYKETISALVGLERLSMPYCDVTDQDTDMFKTLQNLKTLVLNVNQITDASFCADLPKTMTMLGFNGNSIRNMDVLADFTNLEILGVSGNEITDLSFMRNMPNLKRDGIRHAEGTEGSPARLYHEIEKKATFSRDGITVVVDNPYVGVDGKVIPLDGLTVDKQANYTAHYDREKNQVIFENVTDSSIAVNAMYKMPLQKDKSKIFKLRIYVQMDYTRPYTVSYEWGSAPAGQFLPTDDAEYATLDAAKAAVDTTYTKDTRVEGNYGGKLGVWQFSGWTPHISGTRVRFVGRWDFIPDEFTVSYDWGTQAPEDKTLPSDPNVYNTVDRAMAAVDKSYDNQSFAIGVKDGKHGTWRFSGWTAKVENKQVKFTGSWSFKADEYTVKYNWVDAPEGQKLPVDKNIYNTVDEARQAMDTTYTKETSFVGMKDGKHGTWTFGGWFMHTNDKEVQFSGSWTFTADEFTVSYDWGDKVPNGQILPNDPRVYNTEEEAKAAVDTSLHAGIHLRGSMDGIQGVWTFSGWTAHTEGKHVKFIGTWTFEPDAYMVTYDWGTAPEGQLLPVDKTVYNTVEEARTAMDQTFTAETAVAGTKDGKHGTWTFSGWTEKLEGKKLQYTGTWTFTADEYTVVYDWGTAPEGQKLPTDKTVYNTVEEVKAAMDQTFTAETAFDGVKDGKKGTWHFSGWIAAVEGKQVRFTGTWAFDPDAYMVSYDWGTAPEGQKLPVDKTPYNTAEEARAAMDQTFTEGTVVAGTKDGKEGTWHFSGWTEKLDGKKVQYTGTWTFTAKVTPPAKPETPQTGDGIMWVVLLTAASAVALTVTAYARKKEY